MDEIEFDLFELFKGNDDYYKETIKEKKEKQQFETASFFDNLKSNDVFKEVSKLSSLFFNNLEEGVFIIDKNMMLVLCNNAALNIIKKTSEEVIGYKCYKCMNRDSICDNCILLDCINTKQPLYKETDVTGKWMSVKVSPINDEQGNVIGGLEFWQDISAKKIAEQELIEECKRLDEILKHANILDWKYHVKKNKIEFSELWHSVIVDENPTSLLYPDDFSKWLSYKHIDKLFNMSDELIYKGKSTAECEIKLKNKINGIEWFHIKGTVQERDIFFMPVLISGVCIDITNQKHAEEKEKEIANRFKRILEHANIGTWGYDAITQRLHLDDNIIKMVGLQRDLPHGIKKSVLCQYLYQEDYELLFEEADKLMNGEIDKFTVNVRLKNLSLDGHWINIKGFITERDDKGRFIRGEGIVIDINRQKQVEEEIIKLDKSF